MKNLLSVCIFILVCLVFSVSTSGAEFQINGKVKGIWIKPGEVDAIDWKAAWIWADETQNEKAILARKTFVLNTVPKEAVLRISASSQYQLYVNGEYVCRGPARSAPHHQSYDILDISKMLQPGDNLIAVRVHHKDGKRSYQYEGRAGLLAQLNTNEGDTVLISNSDWKLIPDASWDKNAPLIGRFNQVVNDRVDFRQYQKGWELPDFNDEDWSNAVELMRKHGWPSPQKNARAQTLTPPWTSLVPRDIPYLNERDLYTTNLIEAVKIKSPLEEKAHQLTGSLELKHNKGGQLLIPPSGASESWLLVFDFGETINGMPKLNIQGEEGTELKIVSAPFMVDSKFTHITVDSEFLDKIVLSGKQDKWESTYFKPTRYLGIMVKNDAPLKLFSTGIHEKEYPYERTGQIASNDAIWIEDYMNASAKTINVTTTDAITDNYRERRQYAQTAYYAMLGSYYLFDNLELQRRYLLQTSQEQTANGIMPAYAPLAKDDYMIILGSNCLWIRGLRNYYLYSGDEISVRKLLPAALRMMDLLHTYTNKQGLMDNPPFAYWLDHTLNDRRGANLTINGHYWGALNDFAELLSWLDLDGAEVYTERAESLKNSIQLFWDKEKGLFADALIDGKRSSMFSEHGNAMALATGAATTEQAKLVAKQILADDTHNFIKRENGMTMVTPAMSYFLHKGLCSFGYVQESFEMFRRRFEMMLDENTNQTLWEEWWLDGTGRTGRFQGGRTRSDAQTESAFPPALFAEFILGISPTKPGLKEWVIQNRESGVDQISASFPSGNDRLKVEWNKTEEKKSLELYIPEGVLVNVDLNSLKRDRSSPILCNGKTVAGDSAFLVLESGSFEIRF